MASCLEELERIRGIEGVSLGPWIDVPLGYATFNASEFLTQGESKAKVVDQGGVLTLTYDDAFSSPMATSYFQIPNQQSPTLTINGPEVTFPSPGGSVTISRNLTFAFNPAQGEKFDSLWLTSGQMTVQASSTFAANIQLAFSVPVFELNGVAVNQNFNFAAPGNQTRTASMANHTIDLTLNGTTTNTVSFAITAVITDTGQPINNTDKLSLSFGLTGARFRALFGELGPRTIQLPTGSIDLDVFAGVTSKNFVLLAPLVDIQAKNSFGLPLSFDISKFEGVTSSGTVVSLAGAAVSAPLNPYRIGAPTYSQLGQSIASNIKVDGQNSNLGTLVGSLPSSLSYTFGAGLNPGGTATKNFVLDTSRIRMTVHAELPFYGRAEEISFSKQFSFSGIGVDSVGESAIRIRTTNEFPFDARIQAYFLSSSGVVIDSLFSNPTIIKAAPVDASGFTQSGNELETMLPLPQAKLDRIDQATQIQIAAAISTYNTGTVPVKFSPTVRLIVAIGLHTRVPLKTGSN